MEKHSRNFRISMGAVTLPVLAFLVMAAGSYAQTTTGTGDDAGAVELNLITTILTGNIGFAIGLIVTVLGLVTIVRGSVRGGVFLIILGVLVTLLPSVYNSVSHFTCAASEALFGAKCGGQ